MKPKLNRGSLLSDLDADGHKILNLPGDQPLPPPNIPNGSITDIKISGSAAIQQSKLALTGSIPPSFVGTNSTSAAQGDLAEYQANKAQPNGYPSLDSGGKIPSDQLPVLAGTGTVTSVSVTTANGISGTVATATSTPAISLALGNINPTIVTVSGTGGGGYVDLAAQSAHPSLAVGLKVYGGSTSKFFVGGAAFGGFSVNFGNASLTAHRSYTLPDKDGTVVLDSDIPTMVGVGGSHKGGLVIDTGASGAGTDYLARDATWKSASTFSAPSYQPQAPTPFIFPSANTTGAKTVQFGPAGLTGATQFYAIGSSAGPFTEYVFGTSITLAAGATVYVYGAKVGYTNSTIGSYTNPN